jgi:hypothetical protein
MRLRWNDIPVRRVDGSTATGEVSLTSTAGRNACMSKCANASRQIAWLGRKESNLRMAESKSAALPLGYAPTRHPIARKAWAGKVPMLLAPGGH